MQANSLSAVVTTAPMSENDPVHLCQVAVSVSENNELLEGTSEKNLEKRDDQRGAAWVSCAGLTVSRRNLQS